MGVIAARDVTTQSNFVKIPSNNSQDVIRAQGTIDTVSKSSIVDRITKFVLS